MTVPGNLSSPLLAVAGTGAAAAFTLQKSVRFNRSDSASLTRSFSNSSNQKKWTWAGWVKKCLDGENQVLFGFFGSEGMFLRFTSGSFLELQNISSAGNTLLQSSAVYRDPSAWLHVVAVWDTDNSTADNRHRLYVNGVELTDFGSRNNPSSGQIGDINAGVAHAIGDWISSTNNHFDGYLADVYFIDGLALDPTSFGSFDSNGVWQAAAYSGTFGTNGFHLFDFANESTLGHDSSGNNNDFTANNVVDTNGNQTIANATGALPILNTDSTGATVQSGVRADSNASSLKLAIVGGTASGLNLTDQIPSGRGSSNASITNDGVTGTTSSSFFYGGSATVSNGDNFEIADHDDFILGSTFTIEFWAKPDSSATGNEKAIVSHGINASNGYVIMVGTQGAVFRTNGTTDLAYSRTATTDWTHFAFVANSGNKKIFANGTEVASTSGSANDDGGYTTYVGSPDVFSSSHRFTGEFQDVRIYKGLAKYTSSFTVPNIFYSSIAAGNDVLIDVPTNGDTSNDTGAGGEVKGNYCTFNPLKKSAGAELSNGNLQAAIGVTGGTQQTFANFAMSSGKWFWEVQSTSGSARFWGIAKDTAALNEQPGGEASSYGWGDFHGTTGEKWHNGSDSAYGTYPSLNDIVGVAFDADNGTLTFYKNGVSQGVAFTGISGTYFPVVGIDNTTHILNAGQRAFAYSAPSGFKALCTTNLPTPTIADGSNYFEAKTYTGNGSTQTISGFEFSPDLVWLKSRADGEHHGLFDTQRGALYRLVSDYTYASTLRANTLTAFNSDGFSLGSAGEYNGASSEAHIAWAWDAGSSTASNTDGSITSSVRANQTAGFSIVKWTGTGSAATVGHGLGAAPEMIIVKSMDLSKNWIVYHAHIHSSAAEKSINLNESGALYDSAVTFNDTAPTSTVFSVGTGASTNSNGDDHIAYCVSPVAGYSAVGAYDGNGNADGSFVHLGFRPRWIMLKNATNSYSWYIYDTARAVNNVVKVVLIPNAANADTTDADYSIDILSNGFKARTNNIRSNGSSNTYIYLAFAENPFQANGGLAR